MKTKVSTRIWALLLCMLMCVSLLPAEVFAEDGSADFTEAAEETADAESISDSACEVTADPEEASPSDALPVAETEEAANNSDAEVVTDTDSETVNDLSEPVQDPEPESEIVVSPSDAAADNDALFAGYVEQLFNGDSGIFLASASTAGDYLTGQSRAIYDSLKAQIEQVASGEITSTKFRVPTSGILGKLEFTAEDIEAATGLEDVEITEGNLAQLRNSLFTYNAQDIIYALLADCPYELYWYGRTTGTRFGKPSATISEDGKLVFSSSSYLMVWFAVSDDYAAEDSFDDQHRSYTTSLEKTSAATVAVKNAQQIVDNAAGLDDYWKLDKYRQEICNLATYNADAAGGNALYGDPWQLIYVFDNDPDTSVVSEGYAKAFQYLCEKTSFTSDKIRSIPVSGTLDGESHMWNVVRMKNGENYLVDVTNCDTDKEGYPDLLFICSCSSGSVSDGYNVTFSTDVTYTYKYSSEALGDYSENDLTLSQSPYEIPSHDHFGMRTEAVEATCTMAGNKEYWKCSTCGKLFSDDACTTEITADSTVIAALGHTPEHTEAVAPTCTTTGNIEYWKCSTCGKIFSEEACITEITADDTIRPAQHALEHTEAVAPTCTTAGNIEYWKCSTCGKLFSDDACTTEITADSTVIAALGHTPEHTEAVAPTCTTTGNIEYWACSRCNKICSDEAYTNEVTADDIIIPTLKHTPEYTEAVAATCTMTGNNEYWKCSICGKLFSDDACTNEISSDSTVIAALGHDPIYTEAKPATATEAGNKEYWTCSRCAKIYSDDACTTEINEEDTVIPKVTEKVKKLILTGSPYLYNAEDTTQLSVTVYPKGASNAVTWKSSNEKIATVDEETGLVTATGIYGTATITATATDGSKKSAKYTIKVLRPVTSVILTAPANAYSAVDELYYAVAGSSVQMKAAVTPSNAGLKTVEWSLEADDAVAPYLTLNKTGKLTVLKTLPADISGMVIVTAKAIGASEPISESVTLKIVAKATGVTLYKDGVELIKNAKETVWLDQNDSFKLTAAASPAAACQEFTWKSSNTNVATVDEDGNVNAVNKGSTTITATTTDGKKVTAKYTLTVGIPVEDVTITNASTQIYLVPGGSFTPMTTFSPAKPTSKTIEWSLDAGDAENMITFNAKTGKISVNRNYTSTEPVTVTLTACATGAADNVNKTVTFTLMGAKAKQIQLFNENEEEITGKKLTFDAVGDSIKAVVNPEGAGQDVLWKSSNNNVLYVDEDGNLKAMGKGSATITATTMDGSRVSGKVTITVK